MPPEGEPEGPDPLAGHPHYRRIRYLNRGSFGFVVLAEDTRTGEEVAIKFVEVETEKDVKHAHREIMNHLQLLHPHVVQLREVFAAPPYFAIALEYVPGGDMFAYVVSRRGLAEAEARWFFQQLVLGMDYCHRRGVCSRDIKLENTLLVLQPDKKPLLKMCDFGYAKSDVLDSLATSKVGTPGYTAPEVITSPPGGAYDGKLADIWSAAVMLYTMLFARYPFERPEDKALSPAQRTNKVLQRIIRVDYAFPDAPAVSEAAKDLMRRILVAAPGERLSLQGVQAHPWFLTDLPPKSLEYNDWALAVPLEGAQSAAEVDAAIAAAAAARRAATAARRAAGAGRG